MKPYFETEHGQLYHGDCLEIMPDLGQKFDLCLTDPPYGISKKNCKNQARGNLAVAKDYGIWEWDNQIPSKKIFDLIFKISGNQIIFGGNYFAEHLKNSSCWIVWDKDNTGNFADCELMYTSFQSSVRIIKWRWNGMLQQDMKNKEKRFHPTQKPVKLVELILSRYSNPKESIIDPFGGSGTVAIAATHLGHKWVLIEQHEPYCEIAAKRIEEVINQLSF